MIQEFNDSGIPITIYFSIKLGASLERLHKCEIGKEDEYKWSCCSSENPKIHSHDKELSAFKSQKIKELKND